MLRRSKRFVHDPVFHGQGEYAHLSWPAIFAMSGFRFTDLSRFEEWQQ
jgi:hypothetical protein